MFDRDSLESMLDCLHALFQTTVEVFLFEPVDQRMANRLAPCPRKHRRRIVQRTKNIRVQVIVLGDQEVDPLIFELVVAAHGQSIDGFLLFRARGAGIETRNLVDCLDHNRYVCGLLETLKMGLGLLDDVGAEHACSILHGRASEPTARKPSKAAASYRLIATNHRGLVIAVKILLGV